MSEFKESYIFKVCLFGDGGVGKTTLVNRYLSGSFESSSIMTIGVDFRLKKLEVDGNNITLQIWDLAGEERFRALMTGYLNGADGGFFMYDITRLSSLKNVSKWLETLKEFLESKKQHMSLMMVGGKLDLAEKRAFPRKDAEYLGSVNKFQELIECSAKTGENVEEVFENMARILIEKAKKMNLD